MAVVLVGELPNDGEVEDVRDGHATASEAPVSLGINRGVHEIDLEEGKTKVQRGRGEMDGVDGNLSRRLAEPRWTSRVPRRQRTRERWILLEVGERWCGGANDMERVQERGRGLL